MITKMKTILFLTVFIMSGASGIATPVALADQIAIDPKSGGLMPRSSTQTHFIPVWTGNPYNGMNLWVLGASLDGVPLFPGDEIAVFDGTKCVGAAIVSNEISYENILTIITSQDDGSGNGFTGGHQITFRLWDASVSAEQTSITPHFMDTTSGNPIDRPTFKPNGDYGVLLYGEQSVTGLIEGYVIDAYTHNPIDRFEVKVGIYPSEIEIFSFSNGRYFLQRPHNFISLTVTADGYYSSSSEIAIPEGSFVTMDFKLLSIYSKPILVLSSNADTGISNSDNITQKTSNLTIRGLGFDNNGATVQLYDNVNEVSGATGIVEEYEFSIDNISLPEGRHTIIAELTLPDDTLKFSTPLEIIVDTTPPSLSILDPLNYSFNPLFIKGQAQALDTNGLADIELQLSFSETSGYHYLSEDGEFTTTPTWIKLPVQELWHFGTADVNWIEEDIYEVKVRTTDTAGNASDPASIHIIGGVPGGESSVTCELSENSIILGESLRITGQITPSLSQAGTWVDIAFISPDGEETHRAKEANMYGKFAYDAACEDISSGGTWRVRTSWNGDRGLKPAVSEEQTIEVSKAESRVVFEVSSQSVKTGEMIEVGGRFLPVPDCGADLSDIPLSLVISNPDGLILNPDGSGGIPVPIKNHLGHFLHYSHDFSMIGEIFNMIGEWTVKVKFEGNDAYLPTESEPIKVNVVETAGYAIIVQGKTRNGEGLRDHNRTTRFVYDTLIQRDLQPDDIMYFSYDTTQEDADAIPTKTAISEAVTGWAKERMNGHPANLYIVMVNHGGRDRFYIHDSDPVTPADMGSWLDKLQAGLEDNAVNQEIVVILGFCHSGSFIPELSGDNRIIITSAAENELSHRGYKIDETVREGEFFVAEFFKAVSFGKSVRECFEEAVTLTETYTSDLKIPLTPPYYDQARQHPLLNDNGSGEGINDLSLSGSDDLLSGNIFIGVSTQTGNDPNDVSVTRVSDTIFLNESETSTKELWAKVDNPGRVGPVWIEVKAPDYKTETKGPDSDSEPEFTGQLAMELTKEFFTSYNEEADRYEWKGSDGEGVSGFGEPGIYQVFFFAKDMITGNVSRLAETRVYKNRPGNTPPRAFSLLSPEDGEEPPVSLILDWEDAADPDGDSLTYTVLVAGDELFADTAPIIRKEGLPHSACLVTPDDGMEAGRDYYWKVQAVDGYGAVRESGTGMFHTPLVNPDPSWIQGHVYNAATKEPVATFDVVVGEETLDTASEGYYIGEKSPGKYDVMIEAVGYVSDRAEVVITEGEVVTKDFELRENRAAYPVFSPPPGIYTAEQNIRISCATSGAIIRHTADGNEPDENSDEYISPVPVSGDVTIRARAYKIGMDPSRTVTAGYRISTDGNINGDDKVDLADVILALQVLVGTEELPEIYEEYKVSGDDKIGLAEAVYILRELANLTNSEVTE